MKHVFAWTLPHVTRPWLSRYLESILPPSLLISDDYREENKILGVRCLHHIVLNVVRGWEGRSLCGRCLKEGGGWVPVGFPNVCSWFLR